MSETKQTIDTYVVIQISTITYIITAILCLLQAWILSDIIKSNVYDKLVMQLVISLISIFIYLFGIFYRKKKFRQYIGS